MRCGAGDRLYFGGDSEQQQQTDQSQVYNDSRTATQNTWQTRTASDSHANSGNTAGSFNTSTLQQWLSQITTSLTNTNSGNTSTADSHNLSSTNTNTSTSSTSDSGNTSAQWWQANSDSRNLSSNTSDSGNTSSQWWQANSDSHEVANSGNTSSEVTTTTSDSGNSFAQWLSSLTTTTSNSGNTSVTDARNLASSTTDSRSTVVNYTGTDGGLGRITDMLKHSFDGLAGYGAGVGREAAELAALSQANSLTLSTHMLDLTGDLIGRLTTGAALSTAAQVDAVRSTAASATKQSQVSGDSSIKAAWIAGVLALMAVILH